MSEILKKIQEINKQEKTLQSILGKRDIESNIKRIEKLIFALAEEIDEKIGWNKKNSFPALYAMKNLRKVSKILIPIKEDIIKIAKNLIYKSKK